jgi:hypothetical protein
MQKLENAGVPSGTILNWRKLGTEAGRPCRIVHAFAIEMPPGISDFVGDFTTGFVT